MASVVLKKCLVWKSKFKFWIEDAERIVSLSDSVLSLVL